MKKISLIVGMFVFAGLFFLSSCEKDTEYIAPEITIVPADDPVTVLPGGTISYTITYTSVDDLTSAKLTTAFGSNQQIVLDTAFTEAVTNFSFTLDLNFPTDFPVGETGTLTAFASTAHKSTTVESNIEIAKGIDSFTEVLLKAQADGSISADANLSFYSTTTNETFTFNQNDEEAIAPLIDMVFTHHSIFKTNAELSFQSPNEDNLVTMWNDFENITTSYNIENKNQTYFKKVTGVDWENLDFDAIDVAVGEIGTTTILRDINVDDFIAFQTEVGKNGIIKVTETNINHDPYNETTIKFDVKVQK